MKYRKNETERQEKGYCQYFNSTLILRLLIVRNTVGQASVNLRIFRSICQLTELTNTTILQ